ncbi:guanine nucleotide-binding protein-like 3-like protein [Bufo gargarizans]|uniref:guanine nucleotide-binding protein-like 3-like protein n=1 Tax=Bufo gargarizans TaxID=30331 RepID=UPI001CF32A9F|nr:guanine nucleotide-binding protein-like 3-like protein [Bufo gargarizans]
MPSISDGGTRSSLQNWASEVKVEEMKAKQKDARQKELAKRRSLDTFQNDALRRQREFEQKEADLRSLEKHEQLENENSRKAYYREFKKVVEASDVILEVLDARDPLGCRCPQVEQAVVQSGTHKKLVLVLTHQAQLSFIKGSTSTSDAAMILRNCVKIEQLIDPVGPVEAILRRCNKDQVVDGRGCRVEE